MSYCTKLTHLRDVKLTPQYGINLAPPGKSYACRDKNYVTLRHDRGYFYIQKNHAKQNLSLIVFMYDSGTQVFCLPWGNSDNVGLILYIAEVFENGFFQIFIANTKKVTSYFT